MPLWLKSQSNNTDDQIAEFISSDSIKASTCIWYDVIRNDDSFNEMFSEGDILFYHVHKTHFVNSKNLLL